MRKRHDHRPSQPVEGTRKEICPGDVGRLPQINATVALVSISRAQREARMYTDSVEMFEERVRMETGHREHSVDLVEGVLLQKEAQQQPEQSKAEEKAQQIADLQELVIRSAQEAARRADEHERR